MLAECGISAFFVEAAWMGRGFSPTVSGRIFPTKNLFEIRACKNRS